MIACNMPEQAAEIGAMTQSEAELVAAAQARRAQPLTDVQALLDRAMISDQVYRYMKGLDTRDSASIVRSCPRTMC